MQAQAIADPNQRTAKFAHAEQCYRHALRIDPRHAIATQNLAVLYAQLGNVNEGLLTAERAAMFDGVMPAIHVNRAYMCLASDRIDEALASARHAVNLVPAFKKDDPENNFVSTRQALAAVSSTAGLPQDSLWAYEQILAHEPTHAVAGVNVCFTQTLVDSATEDLQRERKRWHSVNKPKGEPAPHDNDRDPDRLLRVGYIGGDFKRHSASMLFGNVLLKHDPAQVEMYLYSSLPVDPNVDDMTKRFQVAAGDRWRDISAQDDDTAAAVIRKDKIDILVDLAAHTGGGRLGVLLRKPAPVQVTAWGFAHGTGCPEIDYFLADPVAVPEDERRFFAEKIWDVPCIVTYLPPEELKLKGTSILPYYKNDEAFFTFGSYHRYEKLSDDCLRVFAEILRRVPNSKIQFKDHAFRRPYSIKRILAAMEGIDPARILPSISTSQPDHMLAYQQADLLLDPFPHTGGTVCCEELYMGVPLLTLYGRQPGGRTASSVLALMGRTEWIARTKEEYVEKAVALAADPRPLSVARKTLRQEFLDSPVVKGYAGKVEEAYRGMWKQWATAK